MPGAEALPTSVGRAEPTGPAEPSPGLHEFGLIGNLRTTALVSRHGSVDWACLPSSASPSVFASLLDRARGGYARVAPLSYLRSEQNYLPRTNVLETRFELAGGASLLLRDFMPVRPDRPELADPRIVRVLEAVGGPVALEIAVAPRFDYARQSPRFRDDGGLWRAWGESSPTLEIRLPFPGSLAAETLTSRGSLAPGQSAAVEIAWGPREREEGPGQLLEETVRFWQEWVHREHHTVHRLAAPYHDWVERSELLLKLLSDGESGAFVAAPTTSLPEWPGGGRNWDYRYVWLRDAAFTAQVFAEMGHYRESQAYLEWVVARIDAEGPGGQLRVMYDARGGRDLAELELDHLSGFASSRPVRVGNGAAEQTQLDIFGEVLDAALLYRELEGGLAYLRQRWPELSRLADTVCELWRLPDHGIWEIRGMPAEYIHSKLMCWVALDRAVRLGEALGGDPRLERWTEERRAVRELLLRHGFDRGAGAFVQAIDRPVLDASSLRIPLVGFLPFDDPRVESTIAAVERELSEGPFVYRYRAPDGFDEPEGAFLLCSFWLVECLAHTGRRTVAEERFEGLLRAASPHGLFSEEFDPAREMPLGNYPQAFTHIGVLRAALALGRTAPS